jgi:polyhydroxyalkanoate synthesis regulator phasin
MATKRKDAPEEVKGPAPKKAFTMQQDLVDLADQYVKSGSVISDAEAHALWESALDGPGVTQNEFATLDHILSTYKFTDKARAYLSKLVTQSKSGKSAYRVIDKVRYDRSCLDLAEHLAKDGKLDLADAKLLWADVEDGPGVTECEKRSIEYVMGKYTVTDGAKAFLDGQLQAWTAPVRKNPPKARARNRTTKKFTLQIDLVQLAEQFKKSAGVISDAEAHKLWESALDGPGVTHNEFATLEHILSNYKFTDKARAYLENLVLQKASGTSFYKCINKIRYDRSCLDLADHLVKDGKLDVADAKQIWDDVEDGGRVTVVEQRTVSYILDQYTVTEGARKFLEKKLAALKPPPAADSKADEEEKAPAAKPAAAMQTAIDLIWTAYDTDNSGDLDRSEAKRFVQDLLVYYGVVDGYTEEGFDELFTTFDKDKSGTIDKAEMVDFVAALGK